MYYTPLKDSNVFVKPYSIGNGLCLRNKTGKIEKKVADFLEIILKLAQILKLSVSFSKAD